MKRKTVDLAGPLGRTQKARWATSEAMYHRTQHPPHLPTMAHFPYEKGILETLALQHPKPRAVMRVCRTREEVGVTSLADTAVMTQDPVLPSTCAQFRIQPALRTVPKAWLYGRKDVKAVQQPYSALPAWRTILLTIRA